MCGRFALRAPLHQLIDQFLFTPGPDLALQPRFNIAPTQPIMALRYGNDDCQRELAAFHWGLVPSWANDAGMGARLINARSETVAAKPSFREAFRQRRCLVPADGYYEWQKEGRRKQPHFFHRADHQLFAFAGLWESWTDPESGHHRESATILTRAANRVTRPIHDRMPVILNVEDYDRWLDPALTDQDSLQSLLMSPGPEDLAVDRVSTRVNSPRNDDAGCLEPPRELF